MQRYIVTEKATGKELLNMEFKEASEVKPKIKEILVGRTLADINVEIQEQDDERTTVLSEEGKQQLAGTRKPRSDTGQSHNKKQEPAKKVRNMGYCIVKGTVTFFPDKPSLDKGLWDIVQEAMRTPEIVANGETPGLDKVIVLQGARTIRVNFQPQFPLEPVKGG